MTISEFVVFVSAVCNFHAKDVPRQYKELCMEYYVNCAVTSDQEKVDRRKLYTCLDKAKAQEHRWL